LRKLACAGPKERQQAAQSRGGGKPPHSSGFDDPGRGARHRNRANPVAVPPSIRRYASRVVKGQVHSASKLAQSRGGSKLPHSEPPLIPRNVERNFVVGRDDELALVIRNPPRVVVTIESANLIHKTSEC
jgi:hypothetical protein